MNKKSNLYYWEVLCDRIDLFMDTRDFFFIIVAFAIFQYCAFLLAYYAGQHSK